jgi:hypothetical protein
MAKTQMRVRETQTNDGSIDVGVERRTAKFVIDRIAFRGISVLSGELGPAEAKSVPYLS